MVWKPEAGRLTTALSGAFFEAWTAVLETAAKGMGLSCPGCGQARKCKRRLSQVMKVRLLGIDLAVPKLYLQCERCDAPGLSVTRLLAGLQSGEPSTELKLVAAYSAAEHSTGKASPRAQAAPQSGSGDIEAHQQQVVERTAVRRMALQVEQCAKDFAEQQRAAALSSIEGEARKQGVQRLMLQRDGGSRPTGSSAMGIGSARCSTARSLGSHSCGRPRWERYWPTTWGWAKRCRRSARSSRDSARWWWRRPASSATDSRRSRVSVHHSACRCITNQAATLNRDDLLHLLA